jgi:hypothetical protein
MLVPAVKIGILLFVRFLLEQLEHFLVQFCHLEARDVTLSQQNSIQDSF